MYFAFKWTLLTILKYLLKVGICFKRCFHSPEKLHCVIFLETSPMSTVSFPRKYPGGHCLFPETVPVWILWKARSTKTLWKWGVWTEIMKFQKKINDLDWASNVFRMRKKIRTRMIITIAGKKRENKLSWDTPECFWSTCLVVFPITGDWRKEIQEEFLCC